MNKGIVMEITEKNIIVMRPDGRFQRLARKKRNCEIGDEISYADEGINWRSPSIAGRSAIAAAVVFCLVLFASFQGKLGSQEVVAYVSIDINPSVELGIDIRERVLELRALNEDGEALIQEVDYKEKPLEAVTAGLLNRAEQTAFSKGEAEIVIASTVIQPDSKIIDTQIAEKLRLQVKEYIQTTHPTQVQSYQIASFVAPQEVRDAASEYGVSMGKYTVYLNAKSSGAAVTLDDLKARSVLSISKEIPEVAQVMAPDKIPTKTDIRKLVEEEKSGELDKMLQERMKNREKANTNKHNAISRPDNRTGGQDPKTDQNPSTIPPVNDKNNKNDDASTNSRTVNVRPGASSPSATNPDTARRDDKKDDRDDKNDRNRNNNRDGEDKRSSGNSEEERRRDEAAKRLEEQKKKEEEARKKQEELREKAQEQREKQAEENRKRLEEEKKKAEEKWNKDEEKRKEQGNKEDDRRKNKDDEKSDSKEEANARSHSLQNDNGESTKVWSRTFTFPIFH